MFESKGTTSTPYEALPASALPRERMAAVGAGALSDVELLALTLRSGTNNANASDLASVLLAEFGTLDRLAAAAPEELTSVHGVGVAKATSIVAAFELGRRVKQGEKSLPLRTAEDVAAMAHPLLDGLRRERLIVIVCDRAARPLRCVVVSDGAADRTIVPVREILNVVLRHDGSAFAVAHNHPSGDPEPSTADVEATAKLATAAKTVGLRFLGHVIVAGDAYSEVPVRPTRRTPD